MKGASRLRSIPVWLLSLAGPVIWFAHFMAVYLLAEAVCAAGGFAVSIAGLPALSFAITAVTAVAAVTAAVTTALAYRRWRATGGAGLNGMHDDRDSGPAFVGFLLGVGFLFAIVIDGLPALLLPTC